MPKKKKELIKLDLKRTRAELDANMDKVVKYAKKIGVELLLVASKPDPDMYNLEGLGDPCECGDEGCNGDNTTTCVGLMIHGTGNDLAIAVEAVLSCRELSGEIAVAMTRVMKRNSKD